MANIEILRILGRAIARRDHDTGSHDTRVTLYAVGIAEAIGVDDQTMRHLIMGAFLHDVGKIAVPDRILLKAGPLSPEEWVVMQTHVASGVEILTKCQGCAWLRDAIEVVKFHHERFDGTGYPARCAALVIPLNARVFAIADVFDALTSNRPYRDRIPFSRAMKEMRAQRGRHFDPDLFDAFGEVARELYDRYADERDDMLDRDLNKVIARYFADDAVGDPISGCVAARGCAPRNLATTGGLA